MSQRFDFQSAPMAGLYTIEKKPISDSRGFFSRLFCAEELQEIGLHKPIVQMNHTHTNKKGSIRGMHYQTPPHAETKIVTCIRGAVMDVAVDIRHNSPTFLHYYTEELTAQNQKSLFIPEGFAHGFQTLSDDCELLYLHTAHYQSDAEAGLNPKDPALGIEWPLMSTELSKRDQNHPMIDQQFIGFINT